LITELLPCTDVTLLRAPSTVACTSARPEMANSRSFLAGSQSETRRERERESERERAREREKQGKTDKQKSETTYRPLMGMASWKLDFAFGLLNGHRNSISTRLRPGSCTSDSASARERESEREREGERERERGRERGREREGESSGGEEHLCQQAVGVVVCNNLRDIRGHCGAESNPLSWE
jgi:hypothetical protein